ncbi:hypothetical protein [Microbacterium lacticum]
MKLLVAALPSELDAFEDPLDGFERSSTTSPTSTASPDSTCRSRRVWRPVAAP